MATSDEQRAPRFFIDHGIIHDRMSGKHLRTVLGESPALDAEVHETLAELNQLDADAAHLATVIAEFVRVRHMTINEAMDVVLATNPQQSNESGAPALGEVER